MLFKGLKIIIRIFGFLENSLELLVGIIFIMLLVMALPLHLIHLSSEKGSNTLTVLVIIGIALSLGICIRDIRKGNWSIFSMIIFLAWFFATLLLFATTK